MTLDKSTAVYRTADALYRALLTMPCTCLRQYPYGGAMVRECRRCVSIREWQDLTQLSTAEGEMP